MTSSPVHNCEYFSQEKLHIFHVILYAVSIRMLTSIFLYFHGLMHFIYNEFCSIIFKNYLFSILHIAPVPSWWDDVYEAADVAKLQLRASRRSEVVKRALFLSPEKSECFTVEKF